MRDSDDVPYIVIERQSGTLGAFLWGALLGAGTALLLAPRSGEQTQEEIRQGVRRARTAAEERVEAARATVTRTRDRLDDQIGSVREQITTVRDQLDTRAERARETFETGRKVARDARADLQRRVSEVKESYGARLERAAGRSDAAGDASGSDVAFTDAPVEDGRTDIG